MKEWSLGVVLPIYEQLVSGEKTIDTRTPDPSNPEKDYIKIEPGDIIVFHAVDKSFQAVEEKPILRYDVESVRTYPTVEDLYENEDMGKILPGIDSVEEVWKIYKSFPGHEQRIRKYGLVAIGLGNKLV